MSMNLTMKLSLLSNTSGTDRLSFSVEKKSTIESPLVNLARVDADGGTTLLSTAGDYILYIKNLGEEEVEVKQDDRKMLLLAQNEFALCPVRVATDIVATSAASSVIEYAYWAKG